MHRPRLELLSVLPYLLKMSNQAELELCPKDTDAPTDNIYMVYGEKINKGS
jgi:hypothetical protein